MSHTEALGVPNYCTTQHAISLDPAVMCACISLWAGEPLDRVQLASELGLMWGAGFEVRQHTTPGRRARLPRASLPEVIFVVGAISTRI